MRPATCKVRQVEEWPALSNGLPLDATHDDGESVGREFFAEDLLDGGHLLVLLLQLLS